MIIMKKLTAIFLCFAMALSLAACGNSSSNETSAPETSDSAASSETQEPAESAESTEEPSSQPETEGEEGGTLVAYFTMPEDVEDNEQHGLPHDYPYSSGFFRFRGEPALF